VHGKFWFVVIVSEITIAFLKSYMEGSSSLSNIFHVTVGACESVDSAFIQLVAGFCVGWSMAEDSADGIISGKRNFDCGIFKQLVDELSLFSYIRKLCPFLCVILFLVFLPFKKKYKKLLVTALSQFTKNKNGST